MKETLCIQIEILIYVKRPIKKWFWKIQKKRSQSKLEISSIHKDRIERIWFQMYLVSCIYTKMQGRKKYPLHKNISQVTKCSNLIYRNLQWNSIEGKQDFKKGICLKNKRKELIFLSIEKQKRFMKTTRVRHIDLEITKRVKCWQLAFSVWCLTQWS